MESTVKGNRKPVSLNYRHYRQLQDMSSTRLKDKSLVVTEEFNEEITSSVLQGNFDSALDSCTHENNFDVGDDGGPCFSGIVEFNSPPATLQETNDKVIDIHSCDSYGIFMEKNIMILRKEFETGVDSSGISNTDSDGRTSTQENKSNAHHISDVDPHDEDDTYGTGRLSSSDSLQECCNQGQRIAKSEDLQSAMVCPIAEVVRDYEDELEIESPKSISLLDCSELNSESSAAQCLDSPTDFDEFCDSEKLIKIKLEGRRRLCKYKAQTQEIASSPIVAENEYQYEYTETNPCVGEIHDIINDLNTKLGHLSIEKSKKSIEAPSDIPSIEDTDSASNEVMILDQIGSFSTHIAPNEAKFLIVDDFDRNQYNGSVLDSNNTIRGDMKKARGNATVANLSFGPKIKDTGDVRVINVEGNNVKPSIKHNQSTKLLNVGSSNYENDDATREADCFILRGPVSCFKLPSKLANFLYPHQRDGLQWLWSLHCLGKGGILGDDMGLGKTMQICAFLAGLFHSRLIKRALVVAPKTLLSHWMKELSIVGLIGMTREYYGTSKSRDYELQYILQDKGVLLTTYDIVRNNWKSLKGNFLDEESDEAFRWDYMILDEGHLIKNPSTQRAKSLLELPCIHRVVISGTPIQNNLKELWALFNFCCPGLLGDNKGFKEKYEQYILKGNEKNASDRDKRIGSTVAKDLRDKIQPYFLRRMKNDVFKGNKLDDVKLSKKNEIIVWLKLTNCQRQLYEAFLQSELVLSAFDGSPLAALTILKKICDHPLLLTKRAAEDVLEGMDSMLSHEDASLAEKLAKHVAETAEKNVFEEKHGSISCKISFIMSLLQNLLCGGHRILIFSQTRKMLNIIQDLLLINGYEFMRIDGTTKACDRVKIVDDFQMGRGAPIFLLTSQVGGLGLTLTRADRVIVVDPAWNPSTDNQSVDRAYRIGQKNDVIVYRLMTCGTVEEKIYRKQIFKGGLFKSATEHKEQIRYFSQQDLRELFSLPKQGFDISLTQKQLHDEHDSQHVMDETFVNHIKFLETLGIAGVSHHNLLFSKTMPAQYVTEAEAEELRKPKKSVTGMSSSSTFVEVDVDGAKFAFDPKDSVWKKKMASPNNEGKLSEADIKEKIFRLDQIVNNKNTLMRLPDQGAKIVKQIEELKSQLFKIHIEGSRVDDITNDLDKVLTFK